MRPSLLLSRYVCCPPALSDTHQQRRTDNVSFVSEKIFICNWHFEQVQPSQAAINYYCCCCSAHKPDFVHSLPRVRCCCCCWLMTVDSGLDPTRMASLDLIQADCELYKKQIRSLVVGLETSGPFWPEWALTVTSGGFLIFAAGRIRLLFGNDWLGSLLRVRYNVKTGSLYHKKKRKKRRQQIFLTCSYFRSTAAWGKRNQTVRIIQAELKTYPSEIRSDDHSSAGNHICF